MCPLTHLHDKPATYGQRGKVQHYNSLEPVPENKVQRQLEHSVCFSLHVSQNTPTGSFNMKVQVQVQLVQIRMGFYES